MRASTCLQANHFKKFVEFCYKLEAWEEEDEMDGMINEKIRKNMINNFIGLLNKSYNIKILLFYFYI